MGLDSRIGRKFLDTGVGYGGSCFPKDLMAFCAMAQKLGYDFKLLREVAEISRAQRERFLRKIREAVWVLKDKQVGILGLAFKPNTDDICESPAVYLIQEILREQARVKAYDSMAMAKAKELLQGVVYCSDP